MLPFCFLAQCKIMFQFHLMFKDFWIKGIYGISFTFSLIFLFPTRNCLPWFLRELSCTQPLTNSCLFDFKNLCLDITFLKISTFSSKIFSLNSKSKHSYLWPNDSEGMCAFSLLAAKPGENEKCAHYRQSWRNSSNNSLPTELTGMKVSEIKAKICWRRHTLHSI